MSMGEISVDRMKELIENKAGSILIAIPEDPSSLTKGYVIHNSYFILNSHPYCP